MKNKTDYSDLDVLYVAYQKLYDFLGNLLDQEFIKITPARNAQYRALVNLIEDITERPENQGLDCFLPKYDDLYSDPTLVEEGDAEWQYTISPLMQKSLKLVGDLLVQRKIRGEVPMSRLSAEIKRAAETTKPVFAVTFPNERTIEVNNRLLSKPHFNSRNEQVFSYIFRNANRRITRNELLANIKTEEGTGNKKIERTLRDLGFDDVLLRIFFPHISISAVYFRNPVRFRDLSNAGITQKEVEDFLNRK